MNERDLIIWMAGFFDGEGCVSISRVRRERPGARTYWQYALQMIVSGRSEDAMRRYHDRWGGAIYAYKLKGVEYWRWNLWGPKAAAALAELLPYLLIKRPVTEVALRFQSMMTQQNEEMGRRGYPPEVVGMRDAFYWQARELNAKNRTNNKAPKYEGPQAIAAAAAK
jgi:hypothetical protein